jgi:hypothetical protein
MKSRRGEVEWLAIWRQHEQRAWFGSVEARDDGRWHDANRPAGGGEVRPRYGVWRLTGGGGYGETNGRSVTPTGGERTGTTVTSIERGGDGMFRSAMRLLGNGDGWDDGECGELGRQHGEGKRLR